MNEVERKVLRDLLLEEFAKHGSVRLNSNDEWHCKCGVDVVTDEHGYPLGRIHIVERLLDVIDACGVTR